MEKYLLTLHFCVIMLLLFTTITSAYGEANQNQLPFHGAIPCPAAEAIVFSGVHAAVSDDPRMAASLLRLHFHDCFVNGCDGSVLLDDKEGFVGEKSAAPNVNSLRGFEVIDGIKAEIEALCPQTVSCADILAMAARDSVVLSGGPGWKVGFGRRDSMSGSKAAAESNIPAPNSTVPILLSKFHNLGFSLTDMVALSGAHTLGKARCASFSSRLQGGARGSKSPDDNGGNVDFIESLRELCAESDSNTAAELDRVTPIMFDNQYYVNLLSGEGLLQSDQALITENSQTREIVIAYAMDPIAFFQDFKKSMIKMGNLKPPATAETTIRTNCRIAS